MAAEDEEVHHDQDDDPSVVPVDGGRASSPPRQASGGGSRGPSPTPPTPPPTGENLADTLAHMVHKGQPIPGLRDEDHLLQGNSESDAENGTEVVWRAMTKERHTKDIGGGTTSIVKRTAKTVRTDQATESDDADIAWLPKKQQRQSSSSSSKRTPSKASEKVIDVDLEEEKTTT